MDLRTSPRPVWTNRGAAESLDSPRVTDPIGRPESP